MNNPLRREVLRNAGIVAGLGMTAGAATATGGDDETEKTVFDLRGLHCKHNVVTIDTFTATPTLDGKRKQVLKVKNLRLDLENLSINNLSIGKLHIDGKVQTRTKELVHAIAKGKLDSEKGHLSDSIAHELETVDHEAIKALKSDFEMAGSGIQRVALMRIFDDDELDILKLLRDLLDLLLCVREATSITDVAGCLVLFLLSI